MITPDIGSQMKAELLKFLKEESIEKFAYGLKIATNTSSHSKLS